MTRPTNPLPCCLLILLPIVYACGDDATPIDPDAGSDATTPADGGLPIDGAPPTGLATDRWGARLGGTAVQLSLVGRDLYIGTRPTPDWTGERLRAGLARVGIEDGSFALLEDELPRAVDPGTGAQATVATAGVLADGERRIAIARSGLLDLTDPATLVPLPRAEGGNASPTRAVLDSARRRLWVTTDDGLYRVDPGTLEVAARIDEATLGGEPGSIALDPATGAVYLSVHPEEAPSFAVRVLDDAVTGTLVPGEGGVPAGAVGDIVFDTEEGRAIVALAAWEASEGGVIAWDGTTASTLFGEGELATAVRGEPGPFGAARLAIDAEDGVLVVGGQMIPGGPTESPLGGGLVFIDLDAPEGTRRLVGYTALQSELPGDHVISIAHDAATRRTFLALMHPCDEHRLGNAGVVALHFEGGRPRFELPVLSGVRDLAVVDGEVVAAVRDDIPGLRCEGIPVQVGLVRLQTDRRGAAASLAGDLPFGFDGVRTPFDLVTSDAAGRLIATGGRQAIFVGPETAGTAMHGPLELGISLFAYDAAWLDERTFLIGGGTSHHEGDPPHLADVGPRGAALVTLDVDGRFASRTHYVRALRDPTPDTVIGLPSSDVRAIVPIAGGGAWLVCGTERYRLDAGDRLEGEPFELDGERRPGGVVRMDATGAIEVVAGGDLVPDGRAAALDDDGSLLVLDAERGLLRVDGGAVTEEPLPLEVPAGSIPRSLLLGEDGMLVAGFSTGAIVRLGGQTLFVGDVGTVWDALPWSDGVILLATDEGVVTVTLDGASVPPGATPAEGALPPYAEAPDLCSGEGGRCDEATACCDGLSCEAGACVAPTGCLEERQPCTGAEACCPGLVCGGSGFVRECVGAP